MDGKKKANSVVTAEFDGEDVITFKVLGAGETQLRLSALSAPVKARALVHGLVQRVSDRAAMSRNPETGQPATAQDKLDRMTTLVEHYMSGSTEWTPGRVEGAGRRKAKALDPVVVAVAEIQGMGYEEVMESIAAKAEKRGVKVKAYIARLATSGEVLAKMAEIAQRGAQGVEEDGDDMLAELMGEDSDAE